MTARLLRHLPAACTALGIFALGAIPLPAADGTPAKSASDGECMDCHEAFTSPVHRNLGCVDCHDSIKETPHAAKLPKVDCASCHDRIAAKHAFHPRLALSPLPAGEDTSCAACHGRRHDTASLKSPDSPWVGPRQAESCGRCHEAARKDYLASAHAQKPGVARTAPDCLSCHREPIVRQGTKGTLVELKLAQAKLCESCHVGNAAVAGTSNLGAKFVASFDHSVHGAALSAGNARAATCIDCHGAHAMNRAAVAGAKVNRLHITETCARCHEDQARAYGTSVHAVALQKGNLDSAGCTSCHGEHDIKLHTDAASPVHKANLAQQVCAECHASVRLTKKYGLASDTFKTFSDSYHGLGVRGGAVEVVNCASCHGVHAIKSQNDPASTINKANLALTCGQCHPGANTRFAVGAVHASEERRGDSPWLYWISNFYVALILAVVGGMAVHNLLDFLKKTRHKLAVQKGEARELHVAHRLYLRMTVNERLQHAVLVLSFTALVVSGFMLRYPEAWWVVGIRQLSARAFEWRGLVHRIASIIMLASGVWHVCYLAFTAAGRALFREMLPAKRDLTDPWGVLKYNLGLAPEKPAFGRFCYIEKAEYWAMAWGTALMTVTGAILWFENASMGYFTKLGFDISRTVHFYEAVLATLAIIVWHFYFVVFNPDVYPMNLAWLTGRMSEGEMMEEHPLQLEAMKAAERAAGTAPEEPPPPLPDEPPAGGI